MALANGLAQCIAKGIAIKKDHVLLQTDCQSAIDAFESRRKVLTPDEKRAKKVLFGLKETHGITVSFRHVKGHTNRTEARYVTNNLCDKRAKEGMRLARIRIQGEAK